MAKDNKNINWDNAKKFKLRCPEPNCGGVLHLKESRFGPFWGCECFKQNGCKGTHGAHPDGTPLGTPADKETKEWRIEAHAVFEDWYTAKNLSRNEAYEQLQRIMGLTSSEAHIGKFDRATSANS